MAAAASVQGRNVTKKSNESDPLVMQFGKEETPEASPVLSSGSAGSVAKKQLNRPKPLNRKKKPKESQFKNKSARTEKQVGNWLNADKNTPLDDDGTGAASNAADDDADFTKSPSPGKKLASGKNLTEGEFAAMRAKMIGKASKSYS